MGRTLLYQLQADVVTACDDFSSKEHVDIGDGVRVWRQPHIGGFQPVTQRAGLGRDLAAALRHQFAIGHGLKTGVGCLGMQTQVQHVELEQLDAPLADHRAWNAQIIFEMAPEVPGIPLQIVLRLGQAHASGRQP